MVSGLEVLSFSVFCYADCSVALSYCFVLLVCRACLRGLGFGAVVCLFCWTSCGFVICFGMVVTTGWVVMVMVAL